MGKKVISNTFTVNTVEDGKNTPFYNKEWYAWSNVATTSDVNTSPFGNQTEPNSAWKEYIPAQGNLAYLWKKVIRSNYVESLNGYVDETAQYFRMSGTNGTSIHTRGQVANASSRGTGTATIITDSGTETITMSDGDAVTQLDDGHLYQWVTEGGGKWLDLGQFKGESGVTYYTHIVWAEDIIIPTNPRRHLTIVGYLPDKPASDTTHNWMGVHVDQNPLDPVSDTDTVLWEYTWSNTKGNKGDKGDDASEVNPNILLRTIFDDGIGKVKEAWSSDWTVTRIDAATDTVVQGRKSLRINMANGQTEYCDLFQVIFGKLKASTWYTVSFNYFATQAWNTFLHSNVGSYPAYYDASAGIIIDGVMQTMSGNNGTWQWPADWTGKRHTMTFKTASDLSGIWDNSQLLFRAHQGCQLALCMPKLEIGQVATAYMANEDDLRGDRGKIGRFFYFGGEFNAADNDPTHVFVVNDAQAPYFEHTESGQKRYHVFNPETSPQTGSMTMAQMWAASSQSFNNKPWEAMTNDFKYLITEAIFAQFAQFGSAIINGDWMLSTNGTINGVAYNNGALYNGSPAYTWFDPQYPNESVNTAHSVNGKEWTGYNFVPNYAVDLLTGATYQQNAYVNGSVRTKSMGLDFVDIRNVYNIDGELQTEFIVGDDTVIYDSQGNSKNIQGYWNFVVGGRTESILLPTNSYANFGQRVILYNPYFSLVDGLVSGVGAIYIDQSQDIRYYQSIRGVGTETVGTLEHPVPEGQYDPVSRIDWVNGVVELMCVPSVDSLSGQLCDWVVLNIGTNIYKLQNNTYQPK